MASQKLGHLISYNYSLVHQNPGIPLTSNKSPIYALSSDVALLPSGQPVQQSMNDVLVNEQLLLQLTDCDSLEEIRVISLRNKDLNTCLRVLANCENLTIAYLQGNAINLQDLMYLQMFRNLKKIDLSQNQISTIPGKNVFSGLLNLRFLYLHENRISNWSDIESLTSLPSIMHLTLFTNPVCQIPGYRHFLVNSIQTLLALDNYVITDEERIEDASFGYRFRGLNEFMKLHIPDYAKEKSAEQHLFNLEVDIYRLKRIFERNSPSILIQSLYRGYRSRNYVKVYFNERKQKIIKIQKVVRGWLMRKKFKKDLRDMLVYTQQEYLMMSNAEIRRKRAGTQIKRFLVDKFRQRQKQDLEQRSALIIQKFYRGRFTMNTSFINALELSKYPRIYFLKEQKPAFIKILKSLMPLFEHKNDLKFEDLFKCIKEDQSYDTIRIAEPDLFEYRQFPLVQFVKPCTQSRIRFHKPSEITNSYSFTLANMLFTPNKWETQRQWELLQMRNCKVSREKLKKVLDTRKKNNVKQQYMFQDQYKDLLMFEGMSLDIIVTICFAVLDHNKIANHDGEQQVLLFFDSLMKKVSSASKIQMAWRAHLFRRDLRKLPIYQIIEKRGAFCIQRWWSNIKLKKRMTALTNIKRHIDKIKSHEIYIEQSLYSNIESIVALIHTQMKFEEQFISFDFGLSNHQITIQQNDRERQKHRYLNQAVPKWFNLSFKTSDHQQSPYHNSLLAFFHFNEGDCQILPVNYVVNYEKCQLDIDRNLYFLQMKCHSIDEAKRRATALALLTYDIHRHVFLQIDTSDMLHDPFMIQNIYSIKQRFGLLDFYNNPTTLEQNKVDVKSNFYDQLKQNHQGLILSEKDHRLSRFSFAFKKLQISSGKQIQINCKDQFESQRMDQELIQRDSRSLIDINNEQNDISQYQTKKIQKEAYLILKERRDMTIKQGVQEFKDLKIAQQTMVKDQFEKYLEEKREEVNKVREISKIIHGEQKIELQKNLSVFLTLNKEEKLLRRELVEKQMEVDFKEKYLKKMNVIQMHRNRQLKKEEQEKFINSFAQAKNLIEKQMKIGKRIKDNHEIKKANKDKIQTQKTQNQFKNDYKQVLRSVVYDNQVYMIPEQSRAQIATQGLKESKRTIYLTGNNNQTGPTMADESMRSFSRTNAKSAARSINRSYFLPPLNDSSIDNNNNNNYQSMRLNQDINQTFSIPNHDMELSRDIEQIYKTTLQNRSFIKQNYKRAVFAEENYPIVKNINQESYDFENGMAKEQNVTLIGILDHSKYISGGGININRKSSSRKQYLPTNLL